MGLIVTPESWEEVDSWIGLHNPEDRAYLYTAAFMGWNYAAKLANENHEGPAGDIEKAMAYILESEDES